jgi:DNA (cytosine-5)-methyltransferase 1
VKLGGLFSGIGGFELAWQRNGGEVAWMCEIDPRARRVLEARFPGVPIYEDVQDVDPAEIEAVDVLSGGSPCQGFSLAGQRTGLLHGESRLFADYVRIMEGLAERGLRWAVWENVPGILSIKNPDGERTFPHVIAALAGAAQPVPIDPKRRWNVGVVANRGRGVAWRVVDSRHFGVPQRRRRVYAAIAFGDPDGSRAGRALLAFPEGLRGDPPACVTKGQVPPAGARVSLADEGITGSVSSKWSKGTGGPAGSEWYNLVSQHSYGMYGSSGVEGAMVEEVPAVTASHGQPGNVAYAPTLTASNDPSRSPQSSEVTQQVAAVHASGYGVRRLTPVECERLQAFPDGWTEPGRSDSARYQALGNAVTVSVPEWLFGRIVDVGL